MKSLYEDKTSFFEFIVSSVTQVSSLSSIETRNSVVKAEVSSLILGIESGQQYSLPVVVFTLLYGFLVNEVDTTSPKPDFETVKKRLGRVLKSRTWICQRHTY